MSGTGALGAEPGDCKGTGGGLTAGGEPGGAPGSGGLVSVCAEAVDDMATAATSSEPRVRAEDGVMKNPAKATGAAETRASR